MPEKQSKNAYVAVIGAGPAGLFAARELANSGVNVAVINRDIKPGGLAEYGIYPSKHKMKEGLRRQFRQVLDDERIQYFGNLIVGLDDDLTLEDLQNMGFDAILVTVGAQGTKWLGLPGEDLKGVYHAKDLVYHYNKLPPFASQEFLMGRRILCVGVGNVMLDIAHWIIHELKADEVIAIARRGPADVKFTKKELEYVAGNLDVSALDSEFERTGPVMKKVGQDPEKAKQFILSALDKAQKPNSKTRFSLNFLVSPKRLLGDEQGRVCGVEVQDTTLELRDGGGTRAVALDTSRVIDADTVVFCIGDRVDESLGLPLDKWGEFAKHPKPRFPIEGISYEAYDPESKSPVDGIFLAGWAREASSGLVGIARKDGTRGAKAILARLNSIQIESKDPIEALTMRITAMDKVVVRTKDWKRLEEAEAARASELGLDEFKYSSNEEMLAAMSLIKAREKA